MLSTYFGFTKNPFLRNISSDEMFKCKIFENLLTRFNYFLKEGGIFLLTGSIGSGKTTALKAFSSSINPNSHKVLYLNDILDKKKDFYKSILQMFSVTPPHYAGDCRNMLKKHLIEMTLVKKQIPIIIFDEAQNLPAFILEEIRLLSNFDYDSRSMAQFILSGHKLLQNRISLHENEALRQRISLKFHLHNFSLEETCAYIQHRLEKVGSSSRIFSDSVLAKIHEESRGIPRLINNIGHALLLAAIASDKKIIDEYLFEQTKDEWRVNQC